MQEQKMSICLTDKFLAIVDLTKLTFKPFGRGV
jgi:hypothetical protein